MNDDNSYNLNSLHEELLILLQQFDQYCRNNSIEYSLAYGSLLGAVRHGGFIPWDDDVDIMLTRGNYLKLMKCLQITPFHSDYIVICPLWLDKIVSVNNQDVSLDLFILDNVPDNKAIAGTKKYLILMMQGMMKSSFSNKGSRIEKVLSVFTFAIGKVFPIKIKQHWYRLISSISDKEETKKIAIYNGVYKYVKSKSYSRKMLEQIENVQFESVITMKYKNHQLFLEETYGDFMTLPPQNERIPSHLIR